MEKKTDNGVLSDEAIVELYFARAESAINETDRKYGRYLTAVALNILGNYEDSEECLNDTYLRTWNSIPPVRPVSLKAFLAKLMRGRAINRYEEKKSQKRIPEELCHPLSELENAVECAEDAEYDEAAIAIGGLVSEYLMSLPDRRFYIFVSRYFYARGRSEIADRLGVSLSTVNKELARSKKELRQKLLEGGFRV